MSLIRYRSLPARRARHPWAGGPLFHDPFFDGFFDRVFADLGGRGDHAVFAPAVDVREDDDGYQVVAELPGVARDDVEIEVHDGVLSLKGERHADEEHEDGSLRFSERVFGSFERRFRLPDTVDADAISASMKDGVLTVSLPRGERAQPRQIEVNA